MAQGFFCGKKEWKVILKFEATITRYDLSATILFKLVDSYLIAFKIARSINTKKIGAINRTL